MSWLLRSSIKKETFAIHQPEIAGVVGMVSCETIWCLTWKKKIVQIWEKCEQGTQIRMKCW